MKRLLLYLAILCFSCTSTLELRTQFPPAHSGWRGIACDPALVELAYYKLLNNETGNAELALYYFRCREKPDYLKELEQIKRRDREWWIRHFPPPLRR